MPLSDGQRDWLTLALIPGVGTASFIRLLARFHTPREVLGASEAALEEVAGPSLARRIREYRRSVDIDAQERRMDEYEVRLITMEDPAYPACLAEIYDPPLALFARGTWGDGDEPSVAIVGTRHATPYGLRMAERLGAELGARGIAVVSGMAAGIDAAAHRGAMDAGGRTIAVLGCGVDIVYPAEHAELMHRMVNHGCAVSSFEMSVKPSKGHFPHRNRIISGLCLGTVVVEAPPGSGSLITARFAAEQGREVFAVPGQAGERNSRGPHSLLREGAKLVESVEDIVAELELPAVSRQAPARESAPPPVDAPLPRPVPARSPVAAVSGVEKEVLAVLNPDGSFVDEIALACRIPVSEALSSLTMLELKGLVRQFSGKRFAPK